MESVTLKNPSSEEMGDRAINAMNKGYDVIIESEGGWVITMKFAKR